MNTIKKGLGRGLSSLIGETKVEKNTNKLSLSEIVPNKFQQRKNIKENNPSIKALAYQLYENNGVLKREQVSDYLKNLENDLYCFLMSV